nr:NAD(P)-binding domain-containing protein [Naasia aerilata]
MARSCLRDGHEVTVWNRTPERAAPLAEDGARLAGSPPTRSGARRPSSSCCSTPTRSSRSSARSPRTWARR